jgi:hypothetical protein
MKGESFKNIVHETNKDPIEVGYSTDLARAEIFYFILLIIRKLLAEIRIVVARYLN